MLDDGHVQTDQILENLEWRISRTYQQAEKETKKKLDQYLEKFKEKDKKKREQLKRGDITRTEYNKWRTGQIATGKRWAEMRDTLAQDYHNANKIAQSVTEGYMPEVYALNFNYGTYEVETQSLMDTSFSLYNREAVERIFRENPDLLPPPGKRVSERIAARLDVRWNKQQVQSVMLQGILQGESIPKIAKRLSSQVSEKNRKAAIRNARTMTTGAESAGRRDSYKRAHGMGINMMQTWVATLDGRTRHSHRMLDGETIEIDGVFSNGCRYPGDPNGAPEEIYNCFIAETSVAVDSDIVRSYKHEYTGKLITIKTSSGVQFTCTPNHPILTPGGWIHANALNQGDNILVTRIRDNKTSWRNPHIDHVFSRFDALHKALNMTGRKRTCDLGVNFHGDIPATNVEIVTQERFLRDSVNPGRSDGVDKFCFKDANKSFFGNGALMKHFRGISVSASGVLRRLCKALTFFCWRLRHAQKHGFRPVALSHAHAMKSMNNDTARDTEFFSKGLDGSPGIVFPDKIINVNVCYKSTHVYNLQTVKGYYFVNSSISHNGNMAIAHNCRCRTIGQFAGFETDVTDLRLRNTKRLGNMSYEEWKYEHAEEGDDE